MIKEFVKDMARYIPSYIVPAVVGIIAIPILTNLFQPADYGNFVLVMTTCSILAMFSTDWLSIAVIRFFSRYQLDNRLGEFYGAIIKLVVISIVVVSLLFAAFLFFGREYISADLYSVMRIGVLVSITISCWGTFISLLRANRLATWYSFFSIWKSVASLGLGIMMVVVFHYGVDGLLWGYFLSAAIALPLLYKLAIQKPLYKTAVIRSSLTWEMAKYSIPLVAVSLSCLIMASSANYILQLFRGSEEVGIFSASNNISSQGVGIIMAVFFLVEGPLIFKLWEKQGAAATGQFVSKLTRYYLMLALPAAVGLGVLAKPIVSVFTAPAYQPGYVIIPLIAFGLVLFGLSGRFSVVFTCSKRTDVLLYCLIGTALLNIILNFVFIPQCGYVAAAFVSTATYAVNLIAIVISSRHFLSWPFPFKSLVKISLASAVMGAAVYFITYILDLTALATLILGIGIGLIVYALMLIMLREPESEEFHQLRSGGYKILGRIMGRRNCK
jgi:O-antigen/teichoic acid export membrane protein